MHISRMSWRTSAGELGRPPRVAIPSATTLEVYASEATTTISGLEDLPDQPCRWNRSDGSVHSAVGCRVTANQRSWRRPWPKTRNANRHSKVTVGTTQRSTAAIASARLRRNVRQVCDGGPRCRIMTWRPQRPRQVGDERTEQSEDRKHRTDDALILPLWAKPDGIFGNDRCKNARCGA